VNADLTPTAAHTEAYSRLVFGAMRQKRYDSSVHVPGGPTLMTLDSADAVKQIDDVLERFALVEKDHTKRWKHESASEPTYIGAPLDVAAETIAAMQTTLERLSPDGEKAAKTLLGDLYDRIDGISSTKMRMLAGGLRALKADYQAGRLKRFGEMVRSDLFSDFLEMAEYLVKDEGLKDPAAVLAGGVLEQHIRRLCDKHGIGITRIDNKGNAVPKKLNLLNQELAKAGAYGTNDQMQIVAWADIRNDAAHAHFDKYTVEQVNLMIQGIRHFLARNTA
jgi:hypothetical protein